MTQLLEKAFAEALKLPEIEQDKFAQWLIDEKIITEQKWDELVAANQTITKRKPSAKIAGKGKILGDIMKPVTDAENWNALA